MAYKDPEAQRAAQRRSYERNKERIKERRRQRRFDLVQRVRDFKVSRGCSRCGFSDSPYALDLHHPGAKGPDDERGHEWNISMMARRGFAWAKIASALEECEVVCANCHRIEHAGNMSLRGGAAIALDTGV